MTNTSCVQQQDCFLVPHIFKTGSYHTAYIVNVLITLSFCHSFIHSIICSSPEACLGTEV